MPLTGIYGKGGSGKNIIVVYFMAKYFRKVKKYVNFNLKLPKTERIDSIKLFELPETDKPIIVIWDEAYTEMEDRNFMSIENRINSYLLFQARKNNMSIISISQLNILDIRWEKLEAYTIACEDRLIYDKNLNHYKGDFNYVFSNGKKAIPFTLKYNTAKKLFPLYNTKEKILPRDFEQMKMKILMNNPKERNKMVNKIVDLIMEKVELPQNKKGLTHNWLRNVLLTLELDFKLEPYVYVRLHSKI